jgi:hypothetical protein
MHYSLHGERTFIIIAMIRTHTKKIPPDTSVFFVARSTSSHHQPVNNKAEDAIRFLF